MYPVTNLIQETWFSNHINPAEMSGALGQRPVRFADLHPGVRGRRHLRLDALRGRWNELSESATSSKS